jgi:GLPGLI family protein
MNEADIKKEEAKNPEPTIKYLDETKTIAGYKCKKAEIVMKTKDGKEETVNVYYTEEIPTTDVKSIYKGLKGFPMEYVMNQGGIKMTFAAKTVSREPVADSKFEIPKEGYTETTMEDFQKSMQQMGQ